jgi:hypothetical protein
MSTPAQITANRANAQLSTGPRTEAGKAAVSQNRATHGLSGANFFLLPHEDQAGFEQLLTAYNQEHRPEGPTASFLVQELAQAHWKLGRAAGIEADLRARGESSLFEIGSDTEKAFSRLTRYQNSIRRDWYRALKELRALGRDQRQDLAAGLRIHDREAEQRIHRILAAEPPQPATPANGGATPPSTPASDNSKPISAAPTPAAKPMPAHLAEELARHRRRDPYFDTKNDFSQMSKHLQAWFTKNPVA